MDVVGIIVIYGIIAPIAALVGGIGRAVAALFRRSEHSR